MKKRSKRFIRELLSIKIEFIVTPAYITLFIISLINIGLSDTKSIIFNLILLFEIPIIFYGLRIARRMLYKIWIG